MFNVFDSWRRRFAFGTGGQAGNRTLVIILILALGGAVCGAGTPAQAAPPDQKLTYTNIRYHLSITDPGTLCVGEERTVRVTPLADITGKIDTDAFSGDHIITGMKVEASTQDANILSVTPASQTTEFGPPRSLLEAYSARYDSGKGIGELIFKLTPKKPGITNLYFKSVLPAKLTGGEPKTTSPGGPVKVQYCRYRVILTYRMLQSSHGTFGVISGFMDLMLTGSGDHFEGTGSIEHHRTESMAPCTFLDHGFKSPAIVSLDLAGPEGNRKANLSVQYQPGQSGATITCPVAGAKDASNSENPGDWLAANGEYKEAGGSRGYPIDYAQWYGSMTITIVPLPGSGN